MKNPTKEEFLKMFLSDSSDDPNTINFVEGIKSGKFSIEIADDSHITDLEHEVEQLMEAFGIEAIMITNESKISDFCFTSKEIEEASNKLGIPIDKREYIYVVAQRIKDMNS